MTPEENLNLARTIAEKIASMDYFSAQLKLVHSGSLRDGEFDHARLQLIRAHLGEMDNVLAHIIPLANKLQPSISIERPATAPEKEEK